MIGRLSFSAMSRRSVPSAKASASSNLEKTSVFSCSTSFGRSSLIANRSSINTHRTVSAKRAARSSRRSLDRALGGPPGHIDFPHCAVIAECLQEKELFGKGLHPFHAQGHAW